MLSRWRRLWILSNIGRSSDGWFATHKLSPCPEDPREGQATIVTCMCLGKQGVEWREKVHNKHFIFVVLVNKHYTAGT